MVLGKLTVGPAPELPQMSPPFSLTSAIVARPDWREVMDTRLSTMGLPIQAKRAASNLMPGSLKTWSTGVLCTTLASAVPSRGATL